MHIWQSTHFSPPLTPCWELRRLSTFPDHAFVSIFIFARINTPLLFPLPRAVLTIPIYHFIRFNFHSCYPHLSDSVCTSLSGVVPGSPEPDSAVIGQDMLTDGRLERYHHPTYVMIGRTMFFMTPCVLSVAWRPGELVDIYVTVMLRD